MKKFTESKLFLYGMIPVCSLCWGFSFLGIKVTLDKLDPVQLLAMRWTIAALVFMILALFKVVKINIKGKSLKWVILTGLLQPCIYSLFETTGVKLTTASESSIFIATIPLMVLILGELFFHRQTSTRTKISIFVALVGVIICVAFSPAFSLGGKGTGYLMLIGAIITGALYSYASSKSSEAFSAVETTFVMAIISCIFFNSLSFAMGYGVSGYVACATDMSLLGGVLFLGLCCSVLCYLIFNYVLAKLPTVIATNLVSNGTTAIGVLAGCLMGGDPFGWYTVVGVGLTITGICMSSTAEN